MVNTFYAYINTFIMEESLPATSDMPWAETRIGPKRIKGAYAWRSFLDTGGTPYIEF